MTYEEIGKAVGKLVDEKNEAYGSSFSKSGQVMRILYPQGIPLDKYDDALAVIRILDKLFRIATDRDALGESPYRDIAGYALLGTARSAQAPPVRVPRAAGKCVKCGAGPGAVNDEGWCQKCFGGDSEKVSDDPCDVYQRIDLRKRGVGG